MSEDEICREMSFESRTAFDRWLITHCIDILSGSVADPLENWLKACEYFGIEPNAGFLENPELAKKMFVSTPKEAQSEEIISAVTEKSAKPPFVLPDGATWEDITIEIVGLDAAKILVGNRIFAASAFEMGFEDRRKKLPNLLWELLIDLAEANGNLGWTTQQRRKNWDTKDFQRLRNTLRAFFNLSDDPFQPYTSETGYQTRFKILYDHTANQ